MMHRILWTLIATLAFAIIPAQAQIGNLKKQVESKTKTEQNQTKEETNKNQTPVSDKSSETKNAQDAPPFLYIGADKLDGTSITELKVCADNYTGANPLRTKFKQWIDEISDTAKEKMFAGKKCELMGYLILDNPGRKYRNADSLETVAQGNSVYKVEKEKLVLVKDFGSAEHYVVVVPEAGKVGLALKDLNLCVTPDLKNTYRKKTASVSNCHDLEQALYVFKQYKDYPGPMQTNSVLFFAKDFETLNKQGKFKGLVIYKLVGEDLVPVK